MTPIPTRWGEALEKHLAAAGLVNPKEIASLTGSTLSTVHRWMRAPRFPRNMHREHGQALCRIIGLEGREALKRITLIPPQSVSVVEAAPGRIDWSEIASESIPKDKLIAGMLTRGASTETLERFMAEMTAHEAMLARKRDAKNATPANRPPPAQESSA